MSEGAVSYEVRDRVAILRIDDGRVNALSPALIEAIGKELDRAEREAGALLVVGRPGRFSAGFDLSIMRQGADAAGALVASGAELALRLFEFPIPVTIACTGHALAMGAILLMSADLRLGAAGDFKIGLNEVAIGMTLPVFGVEFARERLSRRHLTRAVASAEIYDPAGAAEAGFLDRVTAAESLEAEALAQAQRLAALDPTAYRATKQRLWGEAAERIRRSLAGVVASFAGGAP